MKKITNEQYIEMSKKSSPASNSLVTIPMSFLVGGLICAIGQVLSILYQSWGASQKDSSMYVSLTLIVIASILTALNHFDRIAKHAGAGTLVPITGFSNAVTASALEFKSEGMVLGLGAKLFIIAGPVIVYGTLSSIIYGVFLYLFKL